MVLLLYLLVSPFQVLFYLSEQLYLLFVFAQLVSHRFVVVVALPVHPHNLVQRLLKLIFGSL
jgi:hypothetical protein